MANNYFATKGGFGGGDDKERQCHGVFVHFCPMETRRICSGVIVIKGALYLGRALHHDHMVACVARVWGDLCNTENGDGL